MGKLTEKVKCKCNVEIICPNRNRIDPFCLLIYLFHCHVFLSFHFPLSLLYFYFLILGIKAVINFLAFVVMFQLFELPPSIRNNTQYNRSTKRKKKKYERERITTKTITMNLSMFVFLF